MSSSLVVKVRACMRCAGEGFAAALVVGLVGCTSEKTASREAAPVAVGRVLYVSPTGSPAPKYCNAWYGDNMSCGNIVYGNVFRKGDFNLKPGSLVQKEIPGWQPIPWDKIGLYKDEWRTED